MQSLDDAFVGLPTDDTELAFLHLEARFRAELDARLEKTDNGYEYEAICQDYLNHTLAAIEGLGLELRNLGIDATLSMKTYNTQRSDMSERIRELRMAIDAYRIQVKLSKALNPNKYAVTITEPEKAKIRHYLENIRLVVDSWSINAKKKDAIFGKIEALSLEINRSRTRLEIVADLVLTTSSVANKVLTDLEPLRKWMDPLQQLFGDAKIVADETPQITHSSPKLIEAPKKQITGPKHIKNDAPFDDEIPF